MKTNNLSIVPRTIVFGCGILLVIVLFVPLWQIELAAPQYPEGLILKMHPHKLAGNVDIINGLNHYIGMKTLHTEDFIEFKVLPYIIVFFALSCFIVAWLNKRKWLVVLFSGFVAFGIIAMADFWRWEYDYGHNLNPDAAIQVPGMSYQPPLIGYKQLLNFGAYSIPDIGGFLFIAVGLLLLAALSIPYFSKKSKAINVSKKPLVGLLVFFMLGTLACNTGPKPIKLGSDACDYCKMTIADRNFGAEILTTKGKVYKFDDTHCLASFIKEKSIDSNSIKDIYIVDFYDHHDLIEARKAFFLKSPELHSPMGGNTAAFDDEAKLKATQMKVEGTRITWDDVLSNQE